MEYKIYKKIIKRAKSFNHNKYLKEKKKNICHKWDSNPDQSIESSTRSPFSHQVTNCHTFL